MAVDIIGVKWVIKANLCFWSIYTHILINININR